VKGAQRTRPSRVAFYVLSSDPVRVLDVDPDLAVGLAEGDGHLARERSLARVGRIETGTWPAGPSPARGSYGYLVLEGFVGLRFSVAGRRYLEVLGPGELLRPWTSLGPDEAVPSRIEWRVFEPTRVAVLDRRFAEAMAPWPEVAAALMDRLVLRTRRLGFQLAVAAVPSIGSRILLMLWHLADRWGKVTPNGVRLRLSLTHEELAEVVAGTRPTVTTAIGRLGQIGAAEQDTRERTWLLRGEPPSDFRSLRRQVALGA
jgi:CRP/FNR family transcriptional regulator, cyclic AMP receptor protein